MDAKLQQVEIKTSPEMIRLLGKKLYTNPVMAILARELLQNSRDATVGGGSIKFDLAIDGSKVSMVCDDSGTGMDEDTLLNTFLTIGKSGKSTDMEAVGGFGVAKVSLFCSDEWSVHTRDNLVNSSLTFQKGKARKGTRIEAASKIDSGAYRVFNLANLFLVSSNVRNLYLNGLKVRAYKARKTLYTDSRVTISTAPALEGNVNLIIYRIKGLTQFIEQLGYGEDYGFNILVDFDHLGYRPVDDEYPFTMSRENVSSWVREAVRNSTARLVKNVLTAKKTHGAPKGKKEPKERVKKTSTGKIIVDAPKKVDNVHRQILTLWEMTFHYMGVTEANFGLTYDSSTLGEHRYHNGQEFFLVNGKYVAEHIQDNFRPQDSLALVMWMWHLACHELSHRDFSDHDEQFTSREGSLAAKTAHMITEKEAMDKLRWQTRKVIHSIFG